MELLDLKDVEFLNKFFIGGECLWYLDLFIMSILIKFL